jgi:hypothetical protein
VDAITKCVFLISVVVVRVLTDFRFRNLFSCRSQSVVKPLFRDGQRLGGDDQATRALPLLQGIPDPTVSIRVELVLGRHVFRPLATDFAQGRIVDGGCLRNVNSA